MANKIERIDIKSIKDPKFVKELNYSSLTVLCHDMATDVESISIGPM